jgi:hypothetical protein
MRTLGSSGRSTVSYANLHCPIVLFDTVLFEILFFGRAWIHGSIALN